MEKGRPRRMALRDVPPDLLLRQLLQPLHLSPHVGALRARDERVPPLDVIGVYRRRNGRTVAQMLDQVPGAAVALWGLDGTAAELAGATRGTGAGSRLELLNRLEREVSTDRGRWLLVADDDVVVPGAQLQLLVRLAAVAGLDVSQPAHLPRSYASWRFNRQRITPIVRLTRFVESGPLVLFSPRARGVCLPLPEELGMGWGLEATFAAAGGESLRLGVVDATGMRHLTPVSTQYRRDEAESTGRRALAQAGVASYAALQVETSRWPLWRRRPPWVDRADGRGAREGR